MCVPNMLGHVSSFIWSVNSCLHDLRYFAMIMKVLKTAADYPQARQQFIDLFQIYGSEKASTRAAAVKVRINCTNVR